MWGVPAVLVSSAVTVGRDVIALCRDIERWRSLERLVELAPAGLRIVDRTLNDGAIEIVADRAAWRPGQAAAYRRGPVSS